MNKIENGSSIPNTYYSQDGGRFGYLSGSNNRQDKLAKNQTIDQPDEQLETPLEELPPPSPGRRSFVTLQDWGPKVVIHSDPSKTPHAEKQRQKNRKTRTMGNKRRIK